MNDRKHRRRVCRGGPETDRPVTTVVFPVAIFVVSTGAGLAGYELSADFLVPSAALVVAVILTGGFTPRLSNRNAENSSDEFDNRTFN